MKKFLHAFLSLLAALIAVSCGTLHRTVSSADLKTGDLLFLVNEEGNSITKVTSGYRGLSIDHVAIVDGSQVVEATPERGVYACPLDTFLVRLKAEGRSGEQPLILACRIRRCRQSAKADLNASVRRAEEYVGRPYDSLFEPSDSAIYCSELVGKAFIRTDGSPVFRTIPMTFRDSSGNIPEFWTALYEAHDRSVPEGEPGTNPGELSRDSNLHVMGFLRTKYVGRGLCPRRSRK